MGASKCSRRSLMMRKKASKKVIQSHVHQEEVEAVAVLSTPRTNQAKKVIPSHDLQEPAGIRPLVPRHQRQVHVKEGIPAILPLQFRLFRRELGKKKKKTDYKKLMQNWMHLLKNF